MCIDTGLNSWLAGQEDNFIPVENPHCEAIKPKGLR